MQDEAEAGNNATVMWIIGGIGAAVMVTVPPLLIASMVIRAREKKKKTEGENH